MLFGKPWYLAIRVFGERRSRRKRVRKWVFFAIDKGARSPARDRQDPGATSTAAIGVAINAAKKRGRAKSISRGDNGRTPNNLNRACARQRKKNNTRQGKEVVAVNVAKCK